MKQRRDVAGREGVCPDGSRPIANLTMRSPVNWTAAGFFFALSMVHTAIAIPGFLNGRWEAFMSAILGGIFLTVTIICFIAKTEVWVLPAEKRVRMRWGVGALRWERVVRFADIRAVRLTLSGSRKRPESTIELLCDAGDIECPPAKYPRQSALYLAIAMGVELIKVFGDEVAEEQRQRMREMD